MTKKNTSQSAKVSTPNGFLRLFSPSVGFALLAFYHLFQPQTGSFGYLARFFWALCIVVAQVSTPNGFLRLFSRAYLGDQAQSQQKLQHQTGSFGYLAYPKASLFKTLQQGFNPKRVPSAI